MKIYTIIILIVLSSFIALHSHAQDTKPVNSTVVVMDYQDFEKLVHQVDKQSSARVDAINKTIATLQGRPGAENLVKQQMEMLDKFTSPEGKYNAIVIQCCNSNKALLNQQWDGKSLVMIPAIKEIAIILNITADKKLQGYAVRIEDAGTLTDITNKLFDLDTLDQIDGLIKYSYNIY